MTDDATDKHAQNIQRSAKRRGCLLSYSQSEPGRELTQPSPRPLAEPCTSFLPPSPARIMRWDSQYPISSTEYSINRYWDKSASPQNWVWGRWLWRLFPTQNDFNFWRNKYSINGCCCNDISSWFCGRRPLQLPVRYFIIAWHIPYCFWNMCALPPYFGVLAWESFLKIRNGFALARGACISTNMGEHRTALFSLQGYLSNPIFSILAM